MMNTYNTIILLHGSAVLTTKEFRKTLLGDRVFGVDSDPEEIARWPIAEEAAALAELKKYTCEISHRQWNRDALWYLDEYALEYCDCDENGEFICGANYTLAEQPPIKFTELSDGDSESRLHIERSDDIDITVNIIKNTERNQAEIDLEIGLDRMNLGDLYYTDSNKDSIKPFAERRAEDVILYANIGYLSFDQKRLIESTVRKFIEDKISSDWKDRVELREEKYKHVYYYRGEEVSESEALKLAADTTVVEQKGSLVKLKYFDDIYLFDQYDDFNGETYSLEYVIEGDNVVREDYPRSAHHIEKVEYEVDDENCEYPISSEIIGYYIT